MVFAKNGPDIFFYVLSNIEVPRQDIVCLASIIIVYHPHMVSILLALPGNKYRVKKMLIRYIFTDGTRIAASLNTRSG